MAFDVCGLDEDSVNTTNLWHRVSFMEMEYDKAHIDLCLPYALKYKIMNTIPPEDLGMLAAFKVHDAIYGHAVNRDRLHESGTSYHEWLKNIITEAIRSRMQ